MSTNPNQSGTPQGPYAIIPGSQNPTTNPMDLTPPNDLLRNIHVTGTVTADGGIIGPGLFTSITVSPGPITVKGTGTVKIVIENDTAVTGHTWFLNSTDSGTLVVGNETAANSLTDLDSQGNLGARGYVLSHVGAVAPGNCFVLDASDPNYGFLANISATEWAIGYGPDLTALGTNVIVWDNTGKITLAGNGVVDISAVPTAPGAAGTVWVDTTGGLNILKRA